MVPNPENQSLPIEDELHFRRKQEQLEELKSKIQVVTSNLAMPLYMAFWICDLVFAPEHKWLFLSYRIFTVLACLGIHFSAPRARTLRSAQILAVLFTFVCSLFITIMTLQTGGPVSPYYAGLNLACIAMLLFFPLSFRFSLLASVGIFGLFFVGATYLAWFAGGWSIFLVSLFFISSTLIISLVIRRYQDNLRLSELKNRLALEKEVLGRDQVIKVKTQEAINLASLSMQFSPQVVRAIRTGEKKLEGGTQRAQICVIFIDIVGSTERVTRIDKDDVNKVISMFMDDTIRTLLKYDITIDKFLGDGVLAFSNNPIAHPDYIERVLRAALEIRVNITEHKDEYLDYWKRPLDIRIGVSHGYANVGFYGSEKYFRTYTAIGPGINMANRLCSSATPNQIVVSRDVVRQVSQDLFDFELLGEKQLKGFENDVIKVYQLVRERGATATGIVECPHCAKVMSIEAASNGIFNFFCRDCNYTLANDLKKVA